jgi:TonB family protein
MENKINFSCWLMLIFFFFVTAFAQPRIAILDFNGEVETSQQLRKLAEKDGVALVNEQQLMLATKGAGYNGNLNLKIEDARALGLSIGCDFYLIGTAKVQRRLLSEREFYFDVMIAAYVVETQSGRLIKFLFEQARTEKERIAGERLKELTKTIWRQTSDALKSSAILTEVNQIADVYDLDSTEAAKLQIKPPQFFRRLRPIYTATADFMGIAATVELKVIFQSNGQIGNVEVIRWAGFGLEDSALATVKQLRFEPAKLQNKPVNVSAVVQYNFRQEEKAK